MSGLFNNISNAGQFRGIPVKQFVVKPAFPYPVHDWNIVSSNVILRPGTEFVQTVTDAGFGKVNLENLTELQQGDFIEDLYYGNGLQFNEPEHYSAAISLPEEFSIALIIRNAHYTAGKAFAIDRYSFSFYNYGGGLEVRNTDGEILNSFVMPGIKLANPPDSWVYWRAYIIHFNASGVFYVMPGGGLKELSARPEAGYVRGIQVGSWDGSLSRGVLLRAMIFEGKLSAQQFTNVYHTISNL